MKVRVRLAICFAEIIVVLLGVYFEPSHCVRGELWGEAFFDGRPTSYWRGQIDRWIARHDSLEAAEQANWEYRFYTDGPLDMGGYQLGGNGTVVYALESPDKKRETVELTLHYSTRPSLWERTKNLWTHEGPRQGLELPKILSGLYNAEAVWLELETDATYRPFVQRARHVAELLHGAKSDAGAAR